jgi:deoxycytidylate deaminase
VIERYLKLTLGDPIITPTIHEYAMYVAQSAALRSACLSRQVGAAIISPAGDIIATGCNDVPKPGGGFYSAEDGKDDLRCINRYNGTCWNDEYKKRIRKEIRSILEQKLRNPEVAEILSNKISSMAKLKGLLEFSKSVHAEMAAIVSVARNGNASLQNCILYCTTFPCHNCARHIVAVGIKKVYYIEPFEKSLALELHDDSIILEPPNSKSQESKVVFAHFEGVAPRRYIELFRSTFDKKEGGKLMHHDPRKAIPIVPKFMDTYLDYESKVIEYLTKIGFSTPKKEDNEDE